MSSDGSIVAVGAVLNDNNNRDRSGHVRVFEFSVKDQDWFQRGGDLDGEESDDQSGQSVALSKYGSTVAIGASSNDGKGCKSGHVRVYHYSTTNENWVQRGDDIDGEVGDYSG